MKRLFTGLLALCLVLSACASRQEDSGEENLTVVGISPVGAESD